MWLLLLVALGDCRGDPKSIERPSPFVHEFHQHSTIPRDTPIAKRKRRALDADNPIAAMNIDTTTLNNQEQWAVGMAYKFFGMLYVAPQDRTIEEITVVGSSETIAALGGVVVGSASYGDRTITMYTGHIPNIDAFLLVLLHEILHLMGFGSLASPDAHSFTARTNPLTLELDAASVAYCTREHMGAPEGARLYTDPALAHWNSSNDTWHDDLMLPVIQFDATAMSICTAKMVLLSRPEWKGNVCTKEDDCPAGQTCQSLGRHWLRVCQTPPVAKWSRPLDSSGAFVQFVVFSGTVAVLWIGILACHRRPLNPFQCASFA